MTYRYLWTVGRSEGIDPSQVSPQGRYRAVSPRLWLDTQPAAAPDLPQPWPDEALPYLHLFPHRLHVPVLFGFGWHAGQRLMLLENVPVDADGKLLPAIAPSFAAASPTRQVYWLWQMLDLWAPLRDDGVAASLLMPDNLRVEGWRVRLRELIPDRLHPGGQPSLADLADGWRGWLSAMQIQVAEPVRSLCDQMQQPDANTPEGLRAIALQLNELLLGQSTQLSLKLSVAGDTTAGPQRAHNEDACYPPAQRSAQTSLTWLQSPPDLLSGLGIVCDGIGGHAGGEVASQMAVRSLIMQLRALLYEVAEETVVLSPDVVMQQLEAIARVVNNLIATQNDSQNRHARQRMGTTLTLALHLPQRLNGGTAQELYLLNVGDSRAYWITPQRCQLLTVDDDLASREVRLGRATYAEARKLPNASALTQAVGTHEGDRLYPTVQRFIIDEDGVLLLCSDGLSDHDWVEALGTETTQLLFDDRLTLEQTVQTWLEHANQRNGRDNASVVVMRCQVAAQAPKLFDPMGAEWAIATSMPQPAPDADTELSQASRALLFDDTLDEPVRPRSRPADNRWTTVLLLGVTLLTLGAAGLQIWRQMNANPIPRLWPSAPVSEPADSIDP
ncbi:MAG: protein phosphatase 2C domain-containing protein [Cyanobacteria bacterium J069]